MYGILAPLIYFAIGVLIVFFISNTIFMILKRFIFHDRRQIIEIRHKKGCTVAAIEGGGQKKSRHGSRELKGISY